MGPNRVSFRQIGILTALALLLCGSVNAKEDTLARAEELDRQVIQLHRDGRYGDAIPTATEVLAIREKTLGPEHPKVALSLNNLGVLYDKQGLYREAEP